MKFTRTNSPCVRPVSDLRCRDSARYRSGWVWTSLRPRRRNNCCTWVTAKPHADRTSHRLLSKVDMSLLDGAFEVVVSELPLNLRLIITDTSVEGSVTGG